MAKRRVNKTKEKSLIRDPLLNGHPLLPFDETTSQDVKEVSEDEQAAFFLSQWMKLIRPYSEYPRVFNRNAGKEVERLFRDIKVHYIHRVIREGWTEQKYVMVINTLMESRLAVNVYTLDKFGKLFDSSELPIQRRLARESGG